MQALQDTGESLQQLVVLSDLSFSQQQFLPASRATLERIKQDAERMLQEKEEQSSDDKEEKPYH
jgi:hypothetical protein